MTENNNKLAFSKENYFIMLLGIALIIIGYLVMSMDTHEFGFGFLGLTLGPVIVFLGFLTEFVAIFYRSKNKSAKD
ncbi:MAG: DUF3098 domain-containing protein [Bacteroidia bacterium]|nr:DUF3098 domain-containing protein [Bacteroidia bacterium]